MSHGGPEGACRHHAVLRLWCGESRSTCGGSGGRMTKLRVAAVTSGAANHVRQCVRPNRAILPITRPAHVKVTADAGIPTAFGRRVGSRSRMRRHDARTRVAPHATPHEMRPARRMSHQLRARPRDRATRHSLTRPVQRRMQCAARAIDCGIHRADRRGRSGVTIRVTRQAANERPSWQLGPRSLRGR